MKPIQKKKKTGKGDGLERMNLINRYPTFVNSPIRGVRLLFTRTFHLEYERPTLKTLYHQLFCEAMEGQIKYLDSMIRTIRRKRDPLSIEYAEKGIDRKVGADPYVKLRRYIREEYKRYLSERPDMLKALQSGLYPYKKIEVLRGRMAFWALLTVGMEFQRLVEQTCTQLGMKEEEVVEQVLKPLFRKFSLFRHLVALILKFAHEFFREHRKFLVGHNKTGWKILTKRTGYQVSSWLRHRYKTATQHKVLYENYMKFFFTSFSKFNGQIPSEVRKNLENILNKSFKELERTLNRYRLFSNYEEKKTGIADLLDNAIDAFDAEMVSYEYDEDGNLKNQPPYLAEVRDFLEWLRILLRKSKEKTVANFYSVWVSAKNYCMPLDFVLFIEPAIRGVNSAGERILEPWF